MIILALAALACNLSVNTSNQTATSTPQPADLSAALTLAVQTIQAATQQAQSGIPTSTVQPPATPPTVTVSSMTNCRTGPNVNYDLVMQFPARDDCKRDWQEHAYGLLDHQLSRWRRKQLLALGTICHSDRRYGRSARNDSTSYAAYTNTLTHRTERPQKLEFELR